MPQLLFRKIFTKISLHFYLKSFLQTITYPYYQFSPPKLPDNFLLAKAH